MKIKICGLTRQEDIAAANEAKPDYIGLVFAEKSRRYVNFECAKRLKAQLAEEIASVGVFVDAPFHTIEKLAGAGVIDLIQLHGCETPEDAKRIKERLGLPLIKAISAEKEHFVEELRLWQQTDVDYLLLDSGAGGTGLQFDYKRLEAAGKIRKPFFLAGGLNYENVAEAAEQTKPYAVDMSSGVETDGKKDPKKIREAVRRIRNVKR